MSATAPTPAPPTAPRLDVSGTRKVPFGRAVAVELRKMVDTRAGLWLMIVTGLLLVGAAVITLLVVLSDDQTTIGSSGWTEVMTIPLSLLLPIFAITSVTAEWSQRTGLVSFTLEPHRLKLIGAKFVAVVVLALTTIALAFALGALANVTYAGLDGSEAIWNSEASELAWTVALQMAYFLMAFGLAMLLLNTPAAISVYYVFSLLLPFMVYQPLYFIFDWARDLLPWIDITVGTSPLVTGNNFANEPVDVTGTVVAQSLVALTIWVLLPMLVGGRRVSRAEIK